MWKSLQDTLGKIAAQTIVLCLTLLLSPIAMWAAPRCLSWIDSSVPKPIQLRLAALLLVCFCGSLSYGIILRSKNRRLSKELVPKPLHRFLDDYEFVERLGVYRHKTRSGYFCGSCTPKEIVSQLRDAGHGWQCEIQGCSKFHRDPDRPQPVPRNPNPDRRHP